MIDSPEVAGDYYQKIADRIAVGPKFYYRTLVSDGMDIGHGSQRPEAGYQVAQVVLWRYG